MMASKFNTAERAAITRDEFLDRVRAWAPGKIRIMIAQAAKDRRIAEVTKAEHDKFLLAVGALKASCDGEEAELLGILSEHPEWFPDGARTVDVGNAVVGYRRNPAKLKLIDADELVKYSDEHGLGLYSSKIDLAAAAIKKLLKAQEVPGVRLEASETGKIEVKADNLNAEQAGRG